MADFESMVTGLPADGTEATAQLRSDLQAQGSTISNTSPLSPFFVLLAVLLTAPVLYLRNLIINTLLPGIFTQHATGALLDLRAADLDVTRKPAVKLVGLITFFRAGTLGDLPIPLGTVVESQPIDGVVYRVVTTAAGTILDGTSSVKANAEAEAVGAAYNLGEGYYSSLPNPVAGITAVKNEADYILTPGADIESDADLQKRLLLLWRRQSGWHTQDTYRSLISDVVAVDPDDIFFDTAAPRGPGSADAYVVTASGIPDAALVQTADDYINVSGNHGLGDDLRVKAIPALPVPIDVTITAAASLTAAERTQLQADAQNLIRAVFRESATYPTLPRVTPFQRLARSALATDIHEQFGQDVVSVDFAAPVADPVPAMQLPVIPRAALDAAAVVDEGAGKVGLPATAHGLTIGSRVTVAGTVNYNGVYTLDPATTLDVLVIVAAYVAEVLTGAETAAALVVEVA